MKRITCAAALAVLTACGGSGTDMTPTVPTFGELQADVRRLQADQARISRLAPTSRANMPTTGTSTFDGGAVMVVQQGRSEYNLIGDSSLTVNFANDRMSGRAGNFRGFTGSGKLFNADGQVTYGGGQIGVGSEANAFIVDVDGGLTAAGDRIAIDGQALGLFAGNRTGGPIRPRAIQAIGGTDGSNSARLIGTSTLTATVNGRAAIADLAITGEN